MHMNSKMRPGSKKSDRIPNKEKNRTGTINGNRISRKVRRGRR